MKLEFPEHFIFGTSTASYQIETAFEHDWKGILAEDGYFFDRTTDHEKRYTEDINIIASLAPHYRMSLMWSRLQRKPLDAFDGETKAEYHQLLASLRGKNVKIMMVIHHFGNPIWFANLGGWEKSENISLWIDFAKKLVDEFGGYVSSWNTFNEPNLYSTMSFGVGKFPPYKKNLFTTIKVIKNMSKAHNIVYDYIKQKFPGRSVGISHNSAVFAAQNILGFLPAKIADYWYMKYIPSHFTKSDFIGMSFYARIAYDPFPITNLYTPHKIKALKMDHDDLWQYYPQGLMENINRYWKAYKKPIIITENGICTNDDAKRISSIKDYMKIIHQALAEGIDIRGYYHWSTWDNFEWTLGPTFRFGLYECDLETMERRKKPSADVYSKLAHTNSIDL